MSDNVWVLHQRVKQRSGDYCDADGEDWPCDAVMHEALTTTSPAHRAGTHDDEGTGR